MRCVRVREVAKGAVDSKPGTRVVGYLQHEQESWLSKKAGNREQGMASKRAGNEGQRVGLTRVISDVQML
jgi:hypothetical protein